MATLRLVSDHYLILLDKVGMRRGKTSFHFNNMWLKVDESSDLVEKHE